MQRKSLKKNQQRLVLKLKARQSYGKGLNMKYVHSEKIK